MSKPKNMTPEEEAAWKEKKRAARAAYKASPEGKAARDAYEASPEGKAANARYEASPKGKAARARSDVKLATYYQHVAFVNEVTPILNQSLEFQA